MYLPPPSFPTEEARFLAPILRGAPPEDKKKAIQAALCLISYGVEKIMPSHHELPSITDFQITAQYLETEANPASESLGALPWPTIIASLLALLQKLFLQ